MSQTHRFTFNSPLGNLLIEHRNGVLEKLHFTDQEFGINESGTSVCEAEFRTALKHYFSGAAIPRNFSMNPQGSYFENEVWEAVKHIPFGETATYKDIALQLGKPEAARAVGRANGKNPIPLFIPCHRVIGAGEKLTGYSGGLNRKVWLLKHEGSLLI